MTQNALVFKNRFLFSFFFFFCFLNLWTSILQRVSNLRFSSWIGMRVNVEILEFLPFWGGGSWRKDMSSQFPSWDRWLWRRAHCSRAGDGGAGRWWRGLEHTGGKEETGMRRSNEGWNRRVRRREEKLLLAPWVVGTAALLCCVTVLAVPSWVSTFCFAAWRSDTRAGAARRAPDRERLKRLRGRARAGWGGAAGSHQCTTSQRCLVSLLLTEQLSPSVVAGREVSAGPKEELLSVLVQAPSRALQPLQVRQSLRHRVLFCKVEGMGMLFSGVTGKEH